MSLSHQTLKRLPTIKAELLKGTSHEQIGQKLGVTDKTIDRDLDAFLKSGEFETWLKAEWVHLHTIVVHEDPTEAYRNLTKLVSHMLTRKLEAHSEHVETQRILHLHLWKPEAVAEPRT